MRGDTRAISSKLYKSSEKFGAFFIIKPDPGASGHVQVGVEGRGKEFTASNVTYTSQAIFPDPGR